MRGFFESYIEIMPASGGPGGMEMKEINQQFLSGERALFQEHDSRISYCTFADGESPLKESRDLEIDNCLFRWKYPLWYSKNITMKNLSKIIVINLCLFLFKFCLFCCFFVFLIYFLIFY